MSDGERFVFTGLTMGQLADMRRYRPPEWLRDDYVPWEPPKTPPRPMKRSAPVRSRRLRRPPSEPTPESPHA